MNKKGFVLVETIVTSVFVLGIFTFIIANILPIIAEYEKKEDYDSIESIYDAHMIRKMILKDDEAKISKLLTMPSGSGEYYLFDGIDICNFLSNKNYCRTLLSRDFLDVKQVIVTTYTISDEFVKESKNFNRNLKEYVQNMQKYNNTGLSPTLYNYERRLIVEFNDGRVTNIELLFNGSAGGSTCF